MRNSVKIPRPDQVTTLSQGIKKTQEFELIVLFVILLQLINNAHSLSLPSIFPSNKSDDEIINFDLISFMQFHRMTELVMHKRSSSLRQTDLCQHFGS